MIITDEKKRLRAQLKAAREAIPEAQRLAYSRTIVDRLSGLAVVQQSQRCFVFISSGTEVHTHDLIKQLLREGKDVAVPKIVSKTQMIASRLHNWSGLEPAQLGILTPIRAEPVEDAFDVVITPGLGFTAAGHRIGFGAGYYDRWFAAHQVKCKIAIGFEAQIVPNIPTTATDIPVDAIITEARIITLNPAIH